MKNIFNGILPAVITPVTEDQDFAPGGMESLLERLYATGVHGIYVCGTTGEGLFQSVAMRKRVAEMAVKCSPKGKVVIVHVGATEPSDAHCLARHAERIGAQAISSLAPHNADNFAEIKHYYQDLAAAADLPLFVYYFPETSKGLDTCEQILELCEIPRVTGVKFTDFNLLTLHSIKKAGHIVFNGRDEVLVAGLLMGADGGIGSTYNLIPELYLKLYAMAQQQQWQEARCVQDQVNELITIIVRFPLLPTIKTLLKWSGINCGPCLSRPEVLADSHQSELQELLRKSSFADYAFGGRVV